MPGNGTHNRPPWQKGGVKEIKTGKLYNVIFPIWFLWLFPPVFVLAAIGNFVIDSVVLILAALFFKVGAATGVSLKELYKGTIVKVWLFGFLADFLGTIPLILFFAFGIVPSIPQEIQSAVSLNPWSNPWALLIMVGCMILASIFIFFFNYRIALKEAIEEKTLRLKMALTLAIVTTPWTLLVPTQWLYRGF